ncbi:MAG: hypothetical protein KAW82_03140 [Desulfurellaceae bacterium]|nr:hypothetical protein [Desulfurellaceae bacterium]
MSKIFRTVGLLVLVAAFVFSFSGVSKAVPPIDPDNETCTITTFTDIFAAGSEFDPTCTVTETEDYSFEKVLAVNNKIKILYTQDLMAADGETRVIKNFESNTVSDLTTANLEVTKTVMFEGYSGSITSTEKVALMRDDAGRDVVGYCGIGVNIPSSCLDVAMGNSYTASSIKVVTDSEVTGAVTDELMAPMVEHNIIATGTDPVTSPYAIGTVKAGMAVMVLENITPGTPGAVVSTERYEEHASASGLVKLTKEMKYQSKYAPIVGIPSSITKVP